ncbi:MAG: serine/threonine-protein phosphatase [Acidimicrobiia bacterium]|nr:serine/threonine-protein phosphatase [Actinomycetota bacterium]MBL6924269.1 serine/threonine-protein phosphatase [Acidimicrobiia bacterium]MBL6926945.1 serine/threonine-protein phosphatase [Acidimicrobiia bacterium]
MRPPTRRVRTGGTVRLAHAGVTDVGRVRESNQDDFGSVDGIVVLADGMGGHRGGEVAAAEAVAATLEGFSVQTRQGLAGAVLAANRAVLVRAAGDPHLSGMGTTICALAIVVGEDGGDALAVANVGDSRVYRFSEGRLEQVSEDHSLVGDLVRSGELSPDEAARHPQRNILTKALGIEADLAVDTWELVPVVGDRYLLCSDGLVNELDDSRIQRTLRDMAEPEAAAVELVRCAVNAGGHDNVTVVVADVVEALPGSGRTDLSRSRARAERSSTLGVSDGAGSISGTVWRVGGLALSAVLLLGVIVGVIGIYARSGWFVGFHDDHVAVFQGRPSGILWFDPTLTEVANLPVMDLADADRALVIEAIEVGSLEHARKVVVQLEERAQ